MQNIFNYETKRPAPILRWHFKNIINPKVCQPMLTSTSGSAKSAASFLLSAINWTSSTVTFKNKMFQKISISDWKAEDICWSLHY